MTNAIVHPPHYTAGPRETIDVIRETISDRAGFVAFCQGNALKYLNRAGKKGAAADDFAKAAWFCQQAAHELSPSIHCDPRYLVAIPPTLAPTEPEPEPAPF